MLRTVVFQLFTHFFISKQGRYYLCTYKFQCVVNKIYLRMFRNFLLFSMGSKVLVIQGTISPNYLELSIIYRIHSSTNKNKYYISYRCWLKNCHIHLAAPMVCKLIFVLFENRGNLHPHQHPHHHHHRHHLLQRSRRKRSRWFQSQKMEKKGNLRLDTRCLFTFLMILSLKTRIYMVVNK